MKISEITLEQLEKAASEPAAIYDARQLEYKLRQTSFAIPMQRLEAASDVPDAIAFGIEIGLGLARQD